MPITFSTMDDGVIHRVQISAPIDLDGLNDALAGLENDSEWQSCSGYFAEIDQTALQEFSFRELFNFSRKRNETRKRLNDTRPTAVVAPNKLMFGLARIAATFDPNPIGIFFDSESAVAWLREQIGKDDD